MIRNISSLSWIACILLLLGACTENKTVGNNDNGAEKNFRRSVKVAQVQTGGHDRDLVLSGKVEYHPDKIIYYAPLVSGTVEQVTFSLGDAVRKGDKMLSIRSAELSALRAERIGAETELRVATRETQSMRAMFADNLLSEKELLESEARMQQAQAALERIGTDLTHYSFDPDHGNFAVTAPLSGFIVDKKVAPGTPVSADGTPIFTIADLSSVWITANVYARDLSRVKEGQEVEIEVLAYPDEKFKGTISRLSQTFDPEEKVLKARILLENKGLKLKPDMAVTVRVSQPVDIPLLAVPKEALIFDDNRYFVVVQDDGETFRICEVMPQGHTADMTYIASGIRGYENIVITNQLLIYTGLKEKR